MIKQKLYLLTCFCIFTFTFHNVFAEIKQAPKQERSLIYQQYPPTADGTGKVYMGREIAHIMGYQGAAWLERAEREKEERTHILLRALNLKKAW